MKILSFEKIFFCKNFNHHIITPDILLGTQVNTQRCLEFKSQNIQNFLKIEIKEVMNAICNIIFNNVFFTTITFI